MISTNSQINIFAIIGIMPATNGGWLMNSTMIAWVGDELNLHASLRPEELLLLDGEVGPKVQEIIDLVKKAKRFQDVHGISFSEALFVARAVYVATNKGRLICRPVSMRRCSATGKKEEMVVPKKATRKNPLRQPFPRPLQGYELEHRFVIVENAPALGLSKEAFERLQPVLAVELEGVKAEISEKITGQKPRFRRFNILRCDVCEHVDSDDIFMEEADLSWKCPKCDNSNTFKFSPVLSDFVVKRVTRAE